MPKIKLSHQSFNEIASEMERLGFKTSDPHKIEIERSDMLVRPIDWRMANVRRDCLIQATLFCASETKKVTCILDLAEEMLQYVINGVTNADEKEIPKEEKPVNKW